MFENFVVETFTPVIGSLPDLDLSHIFNQPGVNTFIEYLNLVMYLLPFQTVIQIMGCIIGLHTLRVVVAFFKALWGILPVA